MLMKVPAGAAFGLLAVLATAKPNAVDRNFVRDIAQGNRAETQFGRLALKRGHSATLRDYGTRLISDHGHLQDDLVKLAATRGMSARGYLTPKDQRLYAKLDGLRGKQLDATFKEAIVKHHNRANKIYEHEIRDGCDVGVTAYVERNFATIRRQPRRASFDRRLERLQNHV